MIAVDLNQSNLEYDVNALVSAFFPQEEIHIITPVMGQGKREQYQESVKFQIQVDDRTAKITTEGLEFLWIYEPIEEGLEVSFKEGFKRFCYRTLHTLTGKNLPWGCLTGIRPTKLVYSMLEECEAKGSAIQDATLRAQNHLTQKYYVSSPKSVLCVDIAKKERKVLTRIPKESGYSIYIAIPFCPTTCLYCSFLSYPIMTHRKLSQDYVDSLLEELRGTMSLLGQTQPDTIYIGGGTPTSLDEKTLEKLFVGLGQLFDFSKLYEFTVEAGRADSINEEKLAILKQSKISRLCINPQTMNQETLDLIGRKHSAAQVRTAFELARQMGFDNINMDIIVGLPGEGEVELQFTVDQIVDLKPDAMTVHALSVKRTAALKAWMSQNGIPPVYNSQSRMDIAANAAAQMDMKPYYLYRQKNISGNMENIGYAVDRKEGLYNVLMMEECQSILAFGAGSISKFILPSGRIERQENPKQLDLYRSQIGELIQKKAELIAQI
ncbi:MAG: coproporphyrinogen dehydrogenase HemZ [Clostridium sp.]|jgi:oxygen-independent coproporphyrinogen-3 oxidase|nr:coproporphyrinogen dehydrogenase HemZ [Clostridium sp.]